MRCLRSIKRCALLDRTHDGQQLGVALWVLGREAVPPIFTDDDPDHVLLRMDLSAGLGVVTRAGHEPFDLGLVLLVDRLARRVAVQDVAIVQACLIEAGKVASVDAHGDAGWHR